MSCDILIYRLYDAADEINLGKAESLLAAGSLVSRLRLTRVPPKAISLKNPPVDVMLAKQNIVLADFTFAAEIRARLYDFGVISITVRISLPPDTQYAALLDLAIACDKIPEYTFQQPLRSVLTIIQSALLVPRTPTINEDLVIYYFREWQEWDAVPLLLAEKEPVSPETRQQTLAHRLSYAADFTILGWDKAIVYDPANSPDIPDLLEFANAQLLELRYYDLALDREIDKMYDNIMAAESRSSYRRLGQYRLIRKKLLETMADITSITSRVQNSLRITEDVFYARVYTTYVKLLHIEDWEESIDQKIEVIQRSYNLLTEEVVTYRAELMEIAIIVIIFLELILSLLQFHS